MIELDSKFLEDVGLGRLSERSRREFYDHVYQTLELRVGTRLAKRLTEAELNEFEQLMNTAEDDSAHEWLAEKLPDYKEAVNDEFEKLKREIRLVTDEILRNDAG